MANCISCNNHRPHMISMCAKCRQRDIANLLEVNRERDDFESRFVRVTNISGRAINDLNVRIKSIRSELVTKQKAAQSDLDNSKWRIILDKGKMIGKLEAYTEAIAEIDKVKR